MWLHTSRLINDKQVIFEVKEVNVSVLCRPNIGLLACNNT